LVKAEVESSGSPGASLLVPTYNVITGLPRNTHGRDDSFEIPIPVNASPGLPTDPPKLNTDRREDAVQRATETFFGAWAGRRLYKIVREIIPFPARPMDTMAGLVRPGTVTFRTRTD
jgi:hypothetical protein